MLDNLAEQRTGQREPCSVEKLDADAQDVMVVDAHRVWNLVLATDPAEVGFEEYQAEEFGPNDK